MAASAGQVRAGRAFVELLTNNSKLYRGLEEGKKRVEKWANSMRSVSIGMGAAGAAITAPFTKFVTDFTNRGAAIKQMADRFGASAETISRLGFAFERSGGSLESFSGSVEGLLTKISDLGNGESIFGNLNIKPLTGLELRGKTLDEIFDTLAERIKSIPLAGDRIKVANMLGLNDLLPILLKGKAGLDEVRAASDAVGATMSGPQAQRALDLQKGIGKLWDEFRFTLLRVGEVLLPTSELTGDLSDRVEKLGQSARKWIDDNIGLIQSIAGLGAGLLAGGIALAGFSVALKGVATGIGLTITLMKGLAAVIVALASPIGIAVAAMGGLTAAWLTSTENGKKSASELTSSFNTMAQTFQTGWGAIVASVKSGDLGKAFHIAAVTIKAVWYEALASMGNAFKTFVADNRDRIIALAALLGAYQGNKLLGALGPYGRAAGAIGGAAVGGVGASAVMDEIDKIDTTKFSGKAKQLRDELKRLAEESNKPSKPGGMPGNFGVGAGGGNQGNPGLPSGEAMQRMRDAIPMMYAAQKGVFGGPIAAQLGYGDSTAKRQLDATEEIAKNAAVLPGMAQNVGAFVAQARFGR